MSPCVRLVRARLHDAYGSGTGRRVRGAWLRACASSTTGNGIVRNFCGAARDGFVDVEAADQVVEAAASKMGCAASESDVGDTERGFKITSVWLSGL